MSERNFATDRMPLFSCHSSTYVCSKQTLLLAGKKVIHAKQKGFHGSFMELKAVPGEKVVQFRVSSPDPSQGYSLRPYETMIAFQIFDKVQHTLAMCVDLLSKDREPSTGPL